jgi:hypothetical protein
MNRTKTAFLAALGGLLLLPEAARAHVRNYLDTYGYYTLEKNAMEVELWTDRITPAEGESFWQHKTEVEYGITDRWSLGLYGIFVEDQGLSAWQVENRYRLTRPGQLPVDLAGYIEYKGGINGKDSDEWEGKIIAAKELGRWNVSVNGIVEVEKEPGQDEWETHPALALGTAYRANDRVTPGLELFLRENESRITPGLYINIVPGVRLNLGVGFGIVSQADKTQLRSLLEIEF